jgi:hypothetical protein
MAGKVYTGKNGGKYRLSKGRKVYVEHRKKSRRKKK